jgi:hypothetical protein
MLADPMYPFHQYGPGFLSHEKSSHQEHIAVPAKPNIRNKPQGNDEGDGYVYGQEPLK